jgi:hypothetical protein
VPALRTTGEHSLFSLGSPSPNAGEFPGFGVWFGLGRRLPLDGTVAQRGLPNLGLEGLPNCNVRDERIKAVMMGLRPVS